MTINSPPSVAEVAAFALVLSRVAGIFSAIPMFGGKIVPARIKVFTIFSMTLVFYPILTQKGVSGVGIPSDFISLALLLIREAMVGITIAYLVQAVLGSVEFCGQLISTQMGLSIAGMFDPTMGNQSTALSVFETLVAMLLFVTMGMHHHFIRAIVASYDLLPVGAWQMNGDLVKFIIAATSGIFVLAVKLAAPVMVALFAATVVLGIMARSFPQMNVFMNSFPITLGTGFLVLGMSLLPFSRTVSAAFGSLVRNMETAVRLMSH